MYAIHTTPGFIIDSRPTGEAGKLLSIFTRELGLVLATAEGIRFEKSKLRYYTNDYSFGVFSFVRGKEFWKLTSATEGVLETYTIYAISSEGGHVTSAPPNELFVQLSLLLRRLLHGEEPHPELFDVLAVCREFLAANELNDEQLKTLESLTVLRILNSLGYIGAAIELKDFMNSSELTIDLIEKSAQVRKEINMHINKALKESQL